MSLFRTLSTSMMSLSLALGIMVSGAGASAAVILSLDPQPAKIHGAETVFVDINISGLPTMLGAFSLDLNYDPTVFSPVLSAPAGFGDLLGTVSLGEAVVGIDTSAAGVVDLFEVSLLLNAELSALQGAPPIGFTLATIGLFAFDSAAAFPSTVLSTSNIVLSDAAGSAITVDAHPSANILVPEPGPLALFIVGLGGLVFLRQNRRR